MDIFLWILLAFAVFFLVVLIHELGHFVVARLSGMKVLEFGFGIPPKIKKLFTDKKWTNFTLNLLPIGGFVRIFWEDPTSKDAFAKWAFLSRPLTSRLAVLVAGVVMNFLLAWVIFTVIFMTGTKPLSVLPIDVGGPTHSYLLPSLEEAKDSGLIEGKGIVFNPLTGSIAEQSWIQKSSKVIAVNHVPIDTVDTLIHSIQTEKNLQIELKSSSGWFYTVSLQPKDGKIWVQIYEDLQVNANFQEKKFAFLDATTLAAKETYASSILTFKLLWKTFSALLFPKEPAERESAKEMLSGPIGVGNAFVKMVDLQVSWTIIWIFVAMISVNLWVLNILPFPALDGGRMVTTTLYSIISQFTHSKTLYLKIEQWINGIGFLLLMLLMLYVAFLDIGRFF